MINRLIKGYIAVEGIDNAVKLAKTIAKNHYQVCFYEDDCDIWIVSWCIPEHGFCELTEDEQFEIRASRDNVGKVDVNDDDDENDDDEYDESNEKYPWDD